MELIKDKPKTDKQAISDQKTNEKLAKFGMKVCVKCGKICSVDKHDCK